MLNGNLSFEIFCTDPQDVNDEESLAQALSFSYQLWQGSHPHYEKSHDKVVINLKNSTLSIRIKSVDTSNVIADYIESAFIIKVDATVFEDIEPFRLRLLRHLRNTLKFRHIRVLTDEVSAYIANKLYPEINKIESLLRRYLTKFFIQRVGLNWWEVTATKTMIEKVKFRRSDRYEELANLIDEDVALADFDDLGELIYKQTSGFNHPERIVYKLMSIKNEDEFKLLKKELQGNYTKYFKEYFQDKDFEQKWKELIKIRNKVAHQAFFFKNDLESCMDLVQSIKDIIIGAELSSELIVFSVEEREAIRQAAMEAKKDFDDEIGNFKILGKIDLPANSNTLPAMANITESIIMDELSDIEKDPQKYYVDYVGLKWFVTVYLSNKGYQKNMAYMHINSLRDRGVIEIYEVLSPMGFTIKAIKSNVKK